MIIHSGPQGAVATEDVTFAVTATKTNTTMQCKLDADAFAPCTSPKTFSGLADGSHTFSAFATDTLGNVGEPSTRSFTVDTTPDPPSDTTAPQTTITSGPSGTIAGNSASVAFKSSEARSTFRCKLDSEAFKACPSPKDLKGLDDGTHKSRSRPSTPPATSIPAPTR